MGLVNLRYKLMLNAFYALTGHELPQVVVARPVEAAAEAEKKEPSE